MSFFFLITLSLFLYALRFLWPNLRSLSLYHFDTQSLTYDLLNSASGIPNIRITSIVFKIFYDKRFLVSVFTMFMWLKNLSRLVFKNGAHKQISTIKDIPFQFGLLLPRIKIFLHNSIELAVGKEKY